MSISSAPAAMIRKMHITKLAPKTAEAFEERIAAGAVGCTVCESAGELAENATRRVESFRLLTGSSSLHGDLKLEA